MAKHLIVVDSEEKAETFAKQLDGQVETLLVRVTPFYASLQAGDDADTGGSSKFCFTLIPEEEAFAEKLEANIDRDIYLACDNDQRGNYWAWMISEYLAQASAGAARSKRLICTGLNRAEIDRSMREAAPVSQVEGLTLLVRTLFNTAFNSELKRLIGTQYGPGNVLITVPSLTTMFLMNDREQEITKHVEQSTWRLMAQLPGPGGEFTAQLNRYEGVSEDGCFKSEIQAKQAMSLLRQDRFVVKGIKRTPFSLDPPSPYSLVGLLQDARQLLGIPLARSFAMLQRLYYGVTLPTGRTGLIASYLPSPSGVRPEWIVAIRDVAAATYGGEKLAGVPAFAPAGHILLPLQPEITEDALVGNIDKDLCLLYGMIRKRALAALLKPAQGENVEIELSVGTAFTFTAVGRTVNDEGFFAVSLPAIEEELSKTCYLTALSIGQKIYPGEVEPQRVPAAGSDYYTLETLLANLAEFSVQPESTTITMLQDMLDNDYLRMDKDGRLHSTERTMKVVSSMNRVFPSMQNLNLTGYIEQLMLEVLDSRKSLESALKQFHQAINMHGRVLFRSQATAANTPSVRPEYVQVRTSRLSKNIIKASPFIPISAVPLTQKEALSPVEVEQAQSDVREGDSVLALPVDEVSPFEPGKEEPIVGDPAIAGICEGLPDIPAAPELNSELPPLFGPVETPQADFVAKAQEEKAGDRQPGKTDQSEAVAAAVEKSEPVFDQDQQGREPGKQEAVGQSVDGTIAGVGKPCPVCRRPLLLKEDQYGKFLTCSGFPACRHTEMYQASSGPKMLCPVCRGADILLKRTPVGKDFFVCPQAGCDFVAWSTPHGVPCPVCRSPYLVEKQERNGLAILSCPRAGCGYTEPLAGQSAPTPAAESGAPVKKKVFVRKVTAGSGTGGSVRRVRVVKR